MGGSVGETVIDDGATSTFLMRTSKVLPVTLLWEVASPIRAVHCRLQIVDFETYFEQCNKPAQDGIVVRSAVSIFPNHDKLAPFLGS